jgi:DnaJ-class molecular chaperone
MNPAYGMGAANAIRCGYSNTTPMYTWQTCYSCNGLGKTTTSSYASPYSSSSGSSGSYGSSSSSGSSSGYGSSSSSRILGTCTLCKGSGEIFGENVTNLTGKPFLSTWCSTCQTDRFPHVHTRCTRCGGSGKS